MVTVHLTNGEQREHESIELRSGYVFVYETEGENYFHSIDRVYPVRNVQEIDPDDGAVKGAPPHGDGIMFTPD